MTTRKVTESITATSRSHYFPWPWVACEEKCETWSVIHAKHAAQFCGIFRENAGNQITVGIFKREKRVSLDGFFEVLLNDFEDGFFVGV